MPLLDIATTQPCLQNHLGLRAQTRAHALSTKFTFWDERRLCLAAKSFQFPKKTNFDVGHVVTQRSKLLITSVATLEQCLVQKEDGQKNLLRGSDSSLATTQLQPSIGDSTELAEREKLRRMRISKANKGNTPWNKGRKHSAETLWRIRERTRLAMQDPKVKMKLVNLGHAQSEETRKKIGVGVRMGWEKRREKLLVQENCYFEWQNLVAQASRRGLAGEEELQWDSYKILDEQLKLEWLQSVEQRKAMPRSRGSKRAPKSPEQRKKIAEAIAAKWADPEYRERVCSGLAKYHGTSAAAERRPKRKPSGTTQSTKRNSTKKKDTDTNSSLRTDPPSRIERLRLRRSNKPLFKDPSASSKLEMIKTIRAQRATTESKKTEAVERARLLIAEAEKAAKALEVAAKKSPIAHASVMETRKLIAEAIRSIESIETGHNVTNNEYDGGYPSVDSTKVVSPVDKETKTENVGLNQVKHIKINGKQTPAPSKDDDFIFASFALQDKLNGEEVVRTSLNGYSSRTLILESLIGQSDSSKQLGNLEINGNTNCENNLQPNGAKVNDIGGETPGKAEVVTKRWVRGRLVEMAEGA